ncbi:TPM domain-containing protein [Actinoplanes sp. NPDC051494]|uniref:TPM domain-containing protein n=1 Tax=Actinoplanes sp. NPDC051494 TaxID=3363907 RepID=UPI0037BD2193
MTHARRLVLLIVAFILFPAPAWADAPARLPGQVTDTTGALGTGRASVDSALAALREKTGIQLFVVFVDSFDGTAAQQWTDRTAELSDLGDRDALLAVATTDRAYAYSFPDDSRVSDSELSQVAQDDIEPALARGDWPGAVVAAAGGYTDAAGAGGGSGWWIIVILALIIIGALVWVLIRRRRRASVAAPQPAGPTTAELTARANALLVELDDDLRESESELGLATAQYGAAETTRFKTALETSRQDVAEAFRLRMTLDEVPAPGEETRRRVLTEIIARCTAADERLDAESEAFDRLRDLEGRAEEVAAEVETRRAAAEASLPAAAAVLHDLTDGYAGQTVTAVAGNLDQARERLQFTVSALEKTRAALPERAEAALAVRAAEQAVSQAEQLVAGVHQAATDLAGARTTADALIAELESEIATGRSLGGAELAAVVARAETAVTEVRAQLAVDKPDPVHSVAVLQAADAALDRALEQAQDTAERAAHNRALLAQALPVARAEIGAATTFISTRRGVVDANARASLSEAQRFLGLAESLAESDPAAALAHAQQARSLAAAASRSAHTDVQSWGGGGFDAGSFAGAVLGGILSGGGSPGRGHGGGGGWSGGGFGGSGSRGRRTGGSGGGGGRRGGGGRF